MKQTYVGKILEVNPIPEADRIESVVVVCGEGGKWRGTIQKNSVKVDDLVTVFLPDSLLPETEAFEFMARYHYIVRMARFKGVPSECLIMPYVTGSLGDEVSEYFGVTKYEKTLPANISGDIAGVFPWFIPKTDEPNYQTVSEMISIIHDKEVYVTEKADGTSATFYKHDGHFGVCSRNYELKQSDFNVFWQMANKYKLPEFLPEGYAIQAEVVGPNIQKNPMGLAEHEIRAFNVYNISSGQYYPGEMFIDFCAMLHVPTVKVLYVGAWDIDDDDLSSLAVGKYPNGKNREGVVVRPYKNELVWYGKRVSFKIINLDYK